MAQNATGPVDGHGQVAALGLPHQRLGHPFALLIAPLQSRIKNGYPAFVHRLVHMGVAQKDRQGGDVMEGLCLLGGCQTDDLLAALHIGGPQTVVGV